VADQDRRARQAAGVQAAREQQPGLRGEAGKGALAGAPVPARMGGTGAIAGGGGGGGAEAGKRGHARFGARASRWRRTFRVPDSGRE